MREVIDIMVENLKSSAESERQIAVEAAKAKVKEEFIARSRKFIDTIVAAQQNTNMELMYEKECRKRSVAPCREIVRALQTLRESMHLSCCSSPHLSILASVLAHVVGMRSIAIEACQMTIDEAKRLGAAIDLNTTLLRVHIHASSIAESGNSGARYMFRAAMRLTHFSMTQCKIISDYRLNRELSQTLRMSKTLTHLNLEKNCLGPTAAEAIAEGLSENTTLQMPESKCSETDRW